LLHRPPLFDMNDYVRQKTGTEIRHGSSKSSPPDDVSVAKRRPPDLALHWRLASPLSGGGDHLTALSA
jgi:hypothetical protein